MLQFYIPEVLGVEEVWIFNTSLCFFFGYDVYYTTAIRLTSQVLLS